MAGFQEMLNQAQALGVKFLASPPHTTGVWCNQLELNAEDVARLVADPDAFWCEHFRLTSAAWNDWKVFWSESCRCRGIAANGKRCNNTAGNGVYEQTNVESLGPSGFVPGIKDRCWIHAPGAVLSRLRAQGYTLSLVGCTLQIRGPRPRIPSKMMAILEANKGAWATLLRADTARRENTPFRAGPGRS
jgi:hypothetical protein